MRQDTKDRLVAEVAQYVTTRTTPVTNDVMRIPVANYTDPAKLEHEQATLFRTNPLVFGHSSELTNAGDFAARNLAGVPVLVVRQNDGSIAAFLNVCRHRGSAVTLEACGHARAFSCPYHAWTYRLDGSLATIPHENDFGDVDKGEMGLVRLSAAERHGLVWVIVTPGLPINVADFLGEALDDELDGYALDTFVIDRSHAVLVNANWKVVVSGFLETYHLNVLHRTTIGPHIRTNFAPFRSFGRHGCMTAVRNGFPALASNSERDPWTYLINAYQIFPNTMLIWSGTHWELWMSFPTDNPAVADVSVQVLGRPEHVAESPEYYEKNWKVVTDTILTEDFTVGSTIQQGFASGAQAYITLGRNEPGVQHFHASVQ